MQGLRQQILSAPSVEIVEQLLSTGKTYEFASDTTRSRWKVAARRKLAWLKGESPVVVVQEVEQADVVTPKKKRGNKKKLNAVVG